MKHRSLALLGSALATAPFAERALAQAPESTPDELYVIGQRLEETTPQELAKFGNRLEMLDSEQLKLGGFDDLSQALQMSVPGLYVAPKNGPFDYVNCSLQGSRCTDILWLVDGVRTTNRLYDTTTPLDTIPANMVERVEVLYGGQGIFYGTQSVAGVINVVTKSYSGSPTGSVSVGLDENDGTHVNGDFRTGFGDHQLVLFGSKDEADGYHQVADSDYQPSATDRDRGYDVTTFGVKYAYNVSDSSRLSLMYERTDADVDFLRPMWTALGTNARTDDWITAKWDYSPSDTIDLYVKAYWHDWDTSYTEIFNDLNPDGSLAGTQSVDSDHLFWGYEDYGVTGVVEFHNPGSLEYALGYDYQRFSGEDQVWLIEDKTETAQALYGQIRTSAEQLEHSSLALGVRYNTTSGTFDGTVWSFSGQHDFSDSFYLRGQVGTSFRLPDAEELYLNDCCEKGNPNLEPEESESFEVGIGGRSPGAGRGLGWQLIAYRRNVDNLIDIACCDDPNFPDGRFENFDRTLESSGWEAVLDVELSEAMSLSLDYTAIDAKFKGTSVQAQDIPKSLFKAAWTYRGMSAPFDLNVSLLHVGDVYDTVGGIGNVDHGDYTTVDLGAAVYLDQDRRHRIGLRLENLTDEDYVTGVARAVRDSDGASYAARYLGVPRTLHATYSYRF